MLGGEDSAARQAERSQFLSDAGRAITYSGAAQCNAPLALRTSICRAIKGDPRYEDWADIASGETRGRDCGHSKIVCEPPKRT